MEQIDYSDWAAPFFAVIKSDWKSMRICGDFWMMVNPVSKLNRYPIPKTEDIFATLKRGKLFTKLDLGQVYLQLKLEESSKYMVINTCRFATHTYLIVSPLLLEYFTKQWSSCYRVSCMSQYILMIY